MHNTYLESKPRYEVLDGLRGVAAVSGKRAMRLCKFLGEISYPLYITHLPLIYVQMAWMTNNPDATTGEAIMVAVAVFVLSIGLAYASLKLYDLPVREWLTEHWLKGKKAKNS